MKNKLSVLEKIDQYMRQNRQVGHTTTMIEGVQEHDNAIVVVHALNFGKYLGLRPGRYIAVGQIASDNWWDTWSKGRKAPLVVDNAAWYEITKEATEVFEKRYAKLSTKDE